MQRSFRNRSQAIHHLLAEGLLKGGSTKEGREWLDEFERLLAHARDAGDVIAVALDENRENKQRAVAAWALGRLKVRAAVRPLLRLLDQADAILSFYATDALCEIATIAFVPKLLRVLKDSTYPESRSGAAWILHKVTSRQAGPVLRSAALHDPAPSVRSAAIHALISYPSKGTYLVLAKGLLDPADRVRSMATFAVACLAKERGIEVAVPALKTLVHDPALVPGSGSISQDARDALAAIRPHLAGRKRPAQRPRKHLSKLRGSTRVGTKKQK